MAPAPSNEATCQALLQFVTDGRFPDSEAILSSEYPLDIIPAELKEIAKAKETVENEISALSRETAGNIDDWITQAKELHQDIERSRLTAREIVVLHEKGRELQDQVSEAQLKVEQFHGEIAFNEALIKTLEEARTIDNQLAAAQLALGQSQWIQSIELLEEIERSLAAERLPYDTNIAGLLATKAKELRADISSALQSEWTSLVKIDPASHELRLTINSSDRSPDVLAGLGKIQLLNSVIGSFQRGLVNSILRPVIFPTSTVGWRTFSTDGDCVRSVQAPSQPLVSDILTGVQSVFSYLKGNLPPVVIENLLPTLSGVIAAPLINKWLSPSIPNDVSSLDAFQGTLDQVREFVSDLETQGWGGLEDLKGWIGQVPRLWLSLRRSKALDDVRLAMSRSSGKIRRVERVEKQIVSADDDMLAENTVDDDWNAEWSDNEDDKKAPEEPKAKDNQENGYSEDDEEGDESWDWNDENEDAPAPAPAEPTADTRTKPQENGKEDARKRSQQHELVLKESYAITDLPGAVLAIISDQVADADNLAKLGNSQVKLASSRPALLALPTLVVAMFKATAPLSYSHRFNMGQVYLYNDCMYLAEQLRSFSEANDLPKLSADVESIEKFGKAAYGKELQAQRTILTDLLDGCQGFSTCSEEPFLGECKNAMAAAVDRVKDVYREWEPILSRSALLQSIGALMSTAVNKLIIDIEDLSDISDAESQRLAEFCNYLSKLEELFLPDPSTDPNAANQPETIPMTAMYVPNWLKFQYLINILEGSLADIKFLWTEGELKLEFDAEELTELIRALFADSDHRRRAIAEIRRTSGVF